MLRFALFLFFVLFGFIFVNNVSAQAPSPEIPLQDCTESVCLSPSFLEINGNTPSVEITFNNLSPNVTTWHHCSILNEDCEKAEDTISASGGTATVEVCAANEKKLRVNDCDDDDFFHEGKVYQFTLYEDEDKETRGPTVFFYVNHYFPDVTVTSNNNSPLEVVVTGDRRPGPSKNKNRNNYQVVVEGQDQYGNKYKDDRCVTISSDEGSAVAKFGRNDNDENTPMRPGTYTVKVNEQINEGGLKSAFDGCNGGFTFWHIEAIINEGGELVGSPVVCSNESASSYCKKDPNASDLEGMNKLLEEFGELGKFTLLCNKVETNSEGKLECTSINTAIGSIPTNPIAFVERLFSIVLSLAGLGAVILLIYGGYKYMISRGDPEAIKAARETITSAVIGLLFIIFSLVILQVIAGDILNIPGFS